MLLPEVIDMEFKDVFTEKRRSLGLSQNDVAEKLFVTRQAVSRWERGETVPEVETLKSIGLTVPQPVELLYRLDREEGVRLPLDALTPEECAKVLYQYYSEA